MKTLDHSCIGAQHISTMGESLLMLCSCKLHTQIYGGRERFWCVSFTRGTVDEERVEQRRRRGDQRVVAAEQGGREEGEGQARKPHSKSRRRRHRDSGSGTSEMAARQEELEEQEKVEEGAGLTATVDDDGLENNSPLPEMFQGLPGFTCKLLTDHCHLLPVASRLYQYNYMVMLETLL